jgi:hypothetical protein
LRGMFFFNFVWQYNEKLFNNLVLQVISYIGYIMPFHTK